MRDIRPSHDDSPGERSIRNIPLHKKTRHAAVADHTEPPEETPLHLPHRRLRRRPRRFWLLALGVVVVCALAGILLSTVFAGATVTVYPRTEVVTLPASIVAQKSAPVGSLNYETVEVSRTADILVPASGSRQVSRPASGLVTITNAYNTSSQRLIANTRFEAQDGKIYRIRDSVTVPGVKGTTVGSITATIYADSPGPSYNRDSATVFTIPGFKGDPRYSKFSAKSEGAISGGFIGEEPAVAESDLAAAKATLQQQLDAQVRAAAAESIKEGYSAIPGTLAVNYGDLTQTPAEGNKAKLSQTATALGAVVRQADFASAIARASLQGYQGEAINFGDASKMTVNVANAKPSDTSLTLTLSGQSTLVWQFDPNALVQALVGKDKSAFETTIVSFEPAVARATARIRPFWTGTFPDDPELITIKVGETK